ncbi:energy transducer TonB [Synoicihabitans lomoniglobus]|uniref:TonB family protein n=1 Tax=Synoicihabitans lomoniglobus TaxID=2909285 RepID=A0AAF0CQ69_9BACT|nr:TonB family protein [Opitutaceae bacterium LMO-M01]WED66040.1 TonB family protein [Opitutaceae bacterium LMO-M01]
MTRDLIIGLLVSVSLHAGFLFGDRLFPEKEVVQAAVVEEEFTIELMEMPPLEPEPEEIIESTDDAPPEEIEFAPPMQADVPSVNVETPFVQKLQPPPPPGLERPTGIVSIPKTSATRAIGQGMKDLFDLKNLDQQPTPRFQAKPNYPFEMRRAGITGQVVVGFIVDARGNVREAYSVKSSHREFEQAAIQAVSKWRFRPGKKDGRAVNTRMQVPIVFNITDE